MSGPVKGVGQKKIKTYSCTKKQPTKDKVSKHRGTDKYPGNRNHTADFKLQLQDATVWN